MAILFQSADAYSRYDDATTLFTEGFAYVETFLQNGE